MAVIPPRLLRSVGFLYPSKEAASANASGSGGGSAFLVGKPMEGVTDEQGGPRYLVYGVSNRHVVRNLKASILRLNRRDGLKEIIELRPTDWEVHPDGCDLAAVYLSDRLDNAIHDLLFVETPFLVTEAEIVSLGITAGDEVFMIGRFMNHPGDAENIKPAVRTGSVSMMLQPIYNSATKKDELSFAVEMRSRAGFSGSPVAIYRNAMTNPFGVKGGPVTPNLGFPVGFFRLLGVNWGYVFDEKGGNSYLNGVIPAWRILELLEVPALRKKHDEYTDWVKKDKTRSHPAAPAGAEGEPEPDETNHKVRFNRLLSAAVKRPKSSD